MPVFGTVTCVPARRPAACRERVNGKDESGNLVLLTEATGYRSGAARARPPTLLARRANLASLTVRVHY
jgi:hypothetical protein